MVLREMMDGFWDPKIWLPPNITWTDIEPNDNSPIAYADPKHLFIPLPLAILLLVIRYLLERYWFGPIGLSLGIKYTKKKRSRPNRILEQAYAIREKMKHKQIVGLAKQLDWSERQVERWLRLRRSQDRPSTLIKFCESSWRWLYYTCSFSYGMMCLWDKTWLWDLSHSYYGYPHQSVANDIWWYYMFSLASYWSLLFSQLLDVKRKDFWHMCVHHATSLCLLVFSWICNFHRLGSVVILLHDCGDVLLEAAKLAKYAQYQKLCDGLFFAFTFLWVVTRCIVYPFWILYSTLVIAPTVIPMFPAYYIFNALLVVLLGLHGVWTVVVVKVAYKAFSAGQMDGGICSSSSDDISNGTSQSISPGGTPRKESVRPFKRQTLRRWRWLTLPEIISSL